MTLIFGPGLKGKIVHVLSHEACFIPAMQPLNMTWHGHVYMQPPGLLLNVYVQPKYISSAYLLLNIQRIIKLIKDANRELLQTVNYPVKGKTHSQWHLQSSCKDCQGISLLLILTPHSKLCQSCRESNWFTCDACGKRTVKLNSVVSCQDTQKQSWWN